MTPNTHSQMRGHANDQALLHADENALQHGRNPLDEAKDEDDLGPTVCETSSGCYPGDPNETGG